MIGSAEEFVRLRKSKLPVEYDRAAQESAPLAVWHDVVRGFPDMREWVALNKTVPLEILAILATDDDVKVRSTVAMKRKLTPELFDMLSRDVAEQVRVRIAYNSKTPIEILRRMKEDPSALVRGALSDRARVTSLDEGGESSD